MRTASNFPDPGAFIEVVTMSGQRHQGYVDANHVFVGDDFLCLAKAPQPEHETVFTYVRISQIESWTWDCEP